MIAGADLRKLPEILQIAEGLKMISEHVYPNAVHLGEGVIAIKGIAGEQFNQTDIDRLEALGWLWDGVLCCWKWRTSSKSW